MKTELHVDCSIHCPVVQRSIVGSYVSGTYSLESAGHSSIMHATSS